MKFKQSSKPAQTRFRSKELSHASTRSIGIRLGKTSTSKEAPCCRRPLRRRVQGASVALSGGIDLSQSRRHGTARLRTGRIQILQLSAPFDHSWPSHHALSSTRSSRESLE